MEEKKIDKSYETGESNVKLYRANIESWKYFEIAIKKKAIFLSVWP